MSIGGCASKPVLSKNEVVERSYFLMGTSLEMTSSTEARERALTAFDDAFQVVKDAEQRLSTWIPQSELSQVNQSAVGTETKLSPLLLRDLNTAQIYAKKTNYAFNPFIGPLIHAWGLRSGGRVPTTPQIAKAIKASAPGAFTLTHSGVIKNRADANYEEGGFGKGIALDDALDALKLAGMKSAVLNFGGQIAILGDTPVPIAISNPNLRTETLVKFTASRGSVATSGNSEHGINLKTKNKITKIGHLIDSRTGHPAAFAGSITVLAPTATEAETLTKIFVLGLAKGLHFANAHQVKVLWIYPADTDGDWLVQTSQAWNAPLTLAQNCHTQPVPPLKKENE